MAHIIIITGKRRANPKQDAKQPTKELVIKPTDVPTTVSQKELFRKFRGLALAVGLAADLDPDTASWIRISIKSASPGAEAPVSNTGLNPEKQQPVVGSNAAKLKKLVEIYEKMTKQDLMLGSPRADQLLTLIQFNVFRGLLNNTVTLGWDFEWLEYAEPISPWNTSHENIIPTCPLSLHPTAMQRKVKHHPWIDLWPIPRMRDNLLLANDLYDEDRLCNDLLEFCDINNEESGLIVWGEPWDPASWEVSEKFLRSWAWTIKGCADLLTSTNYWRQRRGQSPLVFEM